MFYGTTSTRHDDACRAQVTKGRRGTHRLDRTRHADEGRQGSTPRTGTLRSNERMSIATGTLTPAQRRTEGEGLPVNELEQAERALAEAREQAEGLAAMGSLELRAAVEGGPDHAQQLIDYDVSVRDASRNTVAWYIRVRNLREAQGLPPIAPQYEINPDYGPMPAPEPGTNTLTGKAHLWVLLFGSLNGRDRDQIARCLGDLEGWTPDMAK